MKKSDMLKIIFIVFISIIFYSIMQNLGDVMGVLKTVWLILTPFIIGLCLAFIFNVPLRFFETVVFAKPTKRNGKIWNKLRRPLCMFLSILLIAIILTLFLLLIIPEIRSTVVTVAKELPTRVNGLADSLNSFLERFGLSLDTLENLQIDWNAISSKIVSMFTDRGGTVITSTIDFTSGIFKGVFNIILGFVFSIYLLATKERLTKQLYNVFYAIFKEQTATGFFRIASLSNRIFTKFIIGQFTEALILGVLCYIGMLIFRMPYAIMISSLITITAFIPVFGAFLGTAVGALMILLVNPIMAVWFVVFIIILQQIETNVIYPKVVGKSVGLPGMWVLLSVTVGGSVFGAAGLIISVPLCAVLYCLLREFIDAVLHRKNITYEKIKANIDAVKANSDTEK